MLGNTSIIYGRLPPEVKKRQAELFNDRKTKFLIATNAIGMGLNLSINRIIFLSLTRPSFGGKRVKIDDSELKQIAGRAGRLGHGGGLVTARDHSDLKHIQKVLKNINDNVTDSYEFIDLSNSPKSYDSEKESISHQYIDDPRYKIEDLKINIEKEHLINKSEFESPKSSIFFFEKSTQREIEKAGLFPSYEQISNFYNHVNNNQTKQKVSLSEVIHRFASMAKVEGLYFLQNHDDFCKISDLIEPIELDLIDRYTFATCPINLKPSYKITKSIFIDMVEKFSAGYEIPYPEPVLELIYQLKPIKGENVGQKMDRIGKFEEIHHISDVYKWMSHKFGFMFYDQLTADQIRQDVVELLNKEYYSK